LGSALRTGHNLPKADAQKYGAVKGDTYACYHALQRLCSTFGAAVSVDQHGNVHACIHAKVDIGHTG
jgi:hypothetical protein